jgi:type III secretory pathway lipoprotein EscJ
MSVRVIIKPHIATEVEGVILEKVEVKILRKSISYLKENPTDRTFKVLASSLIPPPAINFRISRFFDLVVLKMISSMVSFSTMFQWFGFPGR